MSLEEQLAAMRAQLKGVIPEDVWAGMERQIEDLRRSGMTERMPKVGDRAPTFALPSSAGELVALEDLLAKGPVVLTFFRGRW